MSLRSLSVEHFRNLQAVKLQPAAGLNVIFGENAAGKTSLLEAIFFLGRVRSFRATRPEQLISQDHDALIVRGEVETRGGRLVRIAVQRSRERSRVRIDGEDVAALSALARFLPVQIINTDSHRLLSEGPPVRRSFLNWGVFHVEHEYYAVWQRYERALRQRNAALKQQDARLARSWEPELSAAGVAVSTACERFVDQLTAAVAPLLQRWLPDVELSFGYRAGWSRERSLAEAFDQGRSKELELGYSLYGPHRADLVIRSGGVEAQHHLSRGQQKLVAIALLLTQSELVNARSPERSILLIDDLPAELDPQRRTQVLELLGAGESQTFITCTHRDALPLTANAARWFHVEHGEYREVV